MRPSRTPKGDALDLESVVVKGALLLREGFRAQGKVDLTNATVDVLEDEISEDEERGQHLGDMILQGLTYRALVGPLDPKKRLPWLARQRPFHPQPYEQLARVLRQMGRDHDAREILFAKQQKMREEGGLTRWGKIKNRFLDWTVGYGFKPWRALAWMLLLFLVGSAVAYRADCLHMMVPSQPSVSQVPYPSFHATLYSLDQFALPPLDLGQKKYWRLTETHLFASRVWLFHLYFILHALGGWTLTGLLLAALTGIMKKE